MCLDKFPVTFRSDGSAVLGEFGETGEEFLEDVEVHPDDLRPDERAAAIIAGLPSHVAERVEAGE